MNKAAQKTLRVYVTAKDTDQRLSLAGEFPLTGDGKTSEADLSLHVNTKHRFQSLLGIGGAITDASAEVFAQLPQDKQSELLRAYYDPEDGIGYTLARTTIHSSDFSSSSYTYVEEGSEEGSEEGDDQLQSFSIEHDQQYRIPLIKKAIAAAGGELLLYASPWSSPAFMKSNANMLHGGKLLPEYFEAWALYIARFIQAYEDNGMPIWGVTVQNEPMAKQIWESQIFNAEEERDFLKNHLGPVLAKQNLASKKIVVWDHNRDLMVERASVIFDDPEAAKYAWGIGFHWYENWSGGDPMFENLSVVNEAYPDKHLLFTEGCNEGFSCSNYQYWPNAERYGESMIKDFNRGTVGWTDWNILLDQHGGPNHVGNYCFAPIHADTTSGELIYTPSYYYLGHFSKFIRLNAQRVSVSSSRSQLIATSFINQDGSLITVVMNHTDEALDYNLYVDADNCALSIPARAIQTLVVG